MLLRPAKYAGHCCSACASQKILICVVLVLLGPKTFFFLSFNDCYYNRPLTSVLPRHSNFKYKLLNCDYTCRYSPSCLGQPSLVAPVWRFCFRDERSHQSGTKPANCVISDTSSRLPRDRLIRSRLHVVSERNHILTPFSFFGAVTIPTPHPNQATCPLFITQNSTLLCPLRHFSSSRLHALLSLSLLLLSLTCLSIPL